MDVVPPSAQLIPSDSNLLNTDVSKGQDTSTSMLDRQIVVVTSPFSPTMKSEKRVLVSNRRDRRLVVEQLPLFISRSSKVLSTKVVHMANTTHAYFVAREGNSARDRGAVPHDLPKALIYESIQGPTDQEEFSLEQAIQIWWAGVKLTDNHHVEWHAGDDHLSVSAPPIGCGYLKDVTRPKFDGTHMSSRHNSRFAYWTAGGRTHGTWTVRASFPI